MKTTKNFFLSGIIGITMLIQGCEENLNNPKRDNGILPSRFKIDIPSSLSNDADSKSALKAASESDTLPGNEIYAHLNTFIAVGEGAAEIVEDIILAIAIYDIDEPMSLSFQGDKDNRVKNLFVIEDAEYTERMWEFGLTITDAASENEPDGGKALQVFWNCSPIEGIAILKPYNIDRQHDRAWLDAIFRIEYSEVGTEAYDTYMTIEIADLPMPDPRLNPFALNSLKMYVGKKGDRIDVFGNSDHPNAQFFTERKGFSWSFVASGFDNQNIGVAEVGLPPSSLDESDREVLLKDYSIKNVLIEEINEWFLNNFGMHPDSSDLAYYLHNADAPGFFNEQGFICGGTSPGEQYTELVGQIDNLSPFNPKDVNELYIEFK
jgi:hypothetical protein